MQRGHRMHAADVTPLPPVKCCRMLRPQKGCTSRPAVPCAGGAEVIGVLLLQPADVLLSITHLSRSALLWMHFCGRTKARRSPPPPLRPGAGAGMCGAACTTSATGTPVKLPRSKGSSAAGPGRAHEAPQPPCQELCAICRGACSEGVALPGDLLGRVVEGGPSRAHGALVGSIGSLVAPAGEACAGLCL
jgi:hypothetical protein